MDYVSKRRQTNILSTWRCIILGVPTSCPWVSEDGGVSNRRETTVVSILGRWDKSSNYLFQEQINITISLSIHSVNSKNSVSWSIIDTKLPWQHNTMRPLSS